MEYLQGWGGGDTWVPLWEKLFLNCALGGAIHTRLVLNGVPGRCVTTRWLMGWGAGEGAGTGRGWAGVREGQLALLLCPVTREI